MGAHKVMALASIPTRIFSISSSKTVESTMGKIDAKDYLI